MNMLASTADGDRGKTRSVESDKAGKPASLPFSSCVVLESLKDLSAPKPDRLKPTEQVRYRFKEQGLKWGKMISEENVFSR